MKIPNECSCTSYNVICRSTGRIQATLCIHTNTTTTTASMALMEGDYRTRSFYY